MTEVETMQRVSNFVSTLGSSRPTSMQLLSAPSCGRSNARDRLAALDTAVNQNGSFEFDRVIKASTVQKRTQKTKAWKSIYIVLRPSTISVYKNEKEDKLRHKIHLSDLTAALLKDPKQKRHNMFGLFTPSRNFHLQAPTLEEAHNWIQLIQQAARIEEAEQEMLLASPTRRRLSSAGIDAMTPGEEPMMVVDRLTTSSPEPLERPSTSVATPYNAELSGNELHSDFSDSDVQQRTHGLSIESLAVRPPTAALSLGDGASRPNAGLRSGSQFSGINIETDPDRVIFQDRLWYLRSKGGVKQWKSTWAVLRPRNVILYKDESEYTAQLIIPLGAIVDVVDIDPISRSKAHCLQIITEEKSYKFCARDEEPMIQCMGAFKSLLAKRRELEARVVASGMCCSACAMHESD